MRTIAEHIRISGTFLRRRDLLRAGFGDGPIRAALATKQIFRVRHGWYSVPEVVDAAAEAVRVGGRLTGRAALAAAGIPVPYVRDGVIDLEVPANACRLRRPGDRRERLQRADRVRVHWTGVQGSTLLGSRWSVGVDDALLFVLAHEPREVAVACCDAVMRHAGWSWARLRAVFERAPARARRWRDLVVRDADSFGETYVRLWFGDEGIPFEPQAFVDGAGRFDGRISPNVYVEVDGGQHDELWNAGPSSFENDREKDAAAARQGKRVLRWSYRMILANWPACLAAARQARADDLELVTRRARHPVPRARARGPGAAARSPRFRKRRRSDAVPLSKRHSPP